jgi:short-subunit dehydrogenase
MFVHIIRNVLTAGTAVFAVAFSKMDANPALFLHDKFFSTDARLDQIFRGKTMWITGASSGVGAELAIQLSRHGANLVLSSRSEEKLKAVAESCRHSSKGSGNSTVIILPMDLSASTEEIESKLDALVEMLGNRTLDFVVLNAGSGQLSPARVTNHSVTEEIFKINTLAPIAVTQSLLQRNVLDRRKGRHLVVTSSVGAKFGVPLSASYAASKHALHGYYDSLKAECPWLRIDLICPGPIATNFHQNHVGRSASSDKNHGNKTKKNVKELKMPVERCVKLMVSSLFSGNGGEHWIAGQPTLLGLYIRQFFPNIFNRLLSTIGPRRVKAWKEGKNLYDPETWKSVKLDENDDEDQ